MPVIGTEIVAKNILAFGGGFIKHVNETMNQVRFVLDKEVTDNISHDDHTISDLRKLDHPYAARWGTSKAEGIHSPYWLVHKQSGALLRSKYSGTDPATITGGILDAAAFVGLDPQLAPHAPFVVFGTSKMIPRPVLIGSRDRVAKQAKEIIFRNLRDFTVGFRGEKTR